MTPLEDDRTSYVSDANIMILIGKRKMQCFVAEEAGGNLTTRNALKWRSKTKLKNPRRYASIRQPCHKKWIKVGVRSIFRDNSNRGFQPRGCQWRHGAMSLTMLAIEYIDECCRKAECFWPIVHTTDGWFHQKHVDATTDEYRLM